MTGVLKFPHGVCLIVAALMMAGVSEVAAQEDYRFDAGVGLGMTGYLGDANTSNLWSLPSCDGEVFLRYIRNPRWAFKTNIYVGALRGDSGKMTNVFPDDGRYKFSTTFYEIGELAEFNFFNYGIGESYRQLKRLTPYIAGGIGATMSRVDGSSHFSMTLPFGIGLKYKPSERVNFGLEFLMKKTFGDKLDGDALDDPMGIKSSFVKNTDWYSTLTFTVSYEFSRRCAVCNYKD